MQAPIITTASRSDQPQRSDGDFEDLSQLQNDFQLECDTQSGDEYPRSGPPKETSHRWMSDKSVLQMSEADQVLFAQRRFKQLPEFYADMDLEGIASQHPLFQKEWNQCLEDSFSIWNSTSHRQDNAPTASCHAAILRIPSFVMMCTWRVWEHTWMIGYGGPCVVEQMIEF